MFWRFFCVFTPFITTSYVVSCFLCFGFRLRVLLFIDGGAVWMWCTIHGIYVLCVMNVVTTMVIGINIGTHNKRFKMLCGCCLLFTKMLLFLQTSNFMSTFLSMLSTGNYHPMIQSISYFRNYHKKWKCIKETRNEYMNTTKLYVILIRITLPCFHTLSKTKHQQRAMKIH